MRITGFNATSQPIQCSSLHNEGSNRGNTFTHQQGADKYMMPIVIERISEKKNRGQEHFLQRKETYRADRILKNATAG